MESGLKRRTPLSGAGRVFCKARCHFVKSTDLQIIKTTEALEKLKSCYHQSQLKPLKIGDFVCNACRKSAANATHDASAAGASSVMSPGPNRRSEVLDLVATSPITTEATAVALQTAVPLSSSNFSELSKLHPWYHRAPEAVLTELCKIPALCNVFTNLSPLCQRELLSGIGQAMQPHLDALEARLAQVTTTTFAGFSSLVEYEFVEFCNSLRDLKAFERGSWAQVETVLNSDACKNLRGLLRHLVSPKGSDRNFARQSRPVKLRKVGLVLLQLGKLRSERFSGFALKFSTYLHFRGVTDDVSLLEIQLGLTVDPKTRREALEKWRQEHSLVPVKQLLVTSVDQVAFVGDNVNVFVGVRDIAAGVRPKQLNMFAMALWLRHLPSPLLERTAPHSVTFSFRSLMLDGAGYSRVRILLTWAVQEVLQLSGQSGSDHVLVRKHVGPLVAATWVPFFLCERDSARPSEMLEILKDLIGSLKLDRSHIWPFYGDMLTCRNVQTAASMLAKDSAKPGHFQAEFGLFHCQMAVVQRLLFKHFEMELRGTAQVFGLKTLLKAPEKNYNTFERICTGAVAAYVRALFSKGKTVGSVVETLFNAVFKPDASKSSRSSIFTTLLVVNFSWKKLVALADGEAIFDLIRFLLPFLATLGSTMYFRFLCNWTFATLNMSPYDRALRLNNMFVNRRGGEGQAKEVDLEFEYLVCAVKRMARPLPHVTAELLERIVRDVPLYEQLRDEVDSTFKPAETTKYRSVRKNDDAISQLSRRVADDFLNVIVDARKKPTPKTCPFLYCFTKFEKKVNKIVSGSLISEKDDAIVIGEEGANLDEIEQEIF